MNLPEIQSYEDQAIDTVISVLNRAREKLGDRQTLKQLARSRYSLCDAPKVSVTMLGPPLAKTAEAFLIETIEKKWNLTQTLMYVLKYLGASKDETSEYYYFEAIFSQPTVSYPIPQATASVFFRAVNKTIEVSSDVPMMTFRLEGHHIDYDVRFLKLTADWILCVLKMKMKIFKRIEWLGIF